MARDEVVATYLARLPARREEAAAEAFVVGQSIGTWMPVPGITPAMRDRHGGRIERLSRLEPGASVDGEAVRDDDTWLLEAAFPTVNFGPQFPMLITTLLGNDPSTSIAARLVDIAIPKPFAAAFPGPAEGTAGWRRITGVADRPLVINMIKPCTGFPAAVGAGFVAQSAAGGVDLIKDDELLADPTFARVAARAVAYSSRLDDVAAATGHRARYVANVTTRSVALVDTAWAALQGGADGLMVNGLATGLDAVQMLAEARLGAPILVHTAGIETWTTGLSGAYGHRVLLARLLRLAGADAVLTSSPHAPRPLEGDRFDAVLQGARDAWMGFPAAMPMVGGGLTADHVGPIVDAAGFDVMIGIGGAIQGHPDGTVAGGQAVMAAVDEAVRRARGRPERAIAVPL